MQFAELLAKAIEVFGDQADAETWLGAPAFGLGDRDPGGRRAQKDLRPRARAASIMSREELEAALAKLPPGPFVSVFVPHEIPDPQALARFQPRYAMTGIRRGYDARMGSC